MDETTKNTYLRDVLMILTASTLNDVEKERHIIEWHAADPTKRAFLEWFLGDLIDGVKKTEKYIKIVRRTIQQ